MITKQKIVFLGLGVVLLSMFAWVLVLYTGHRTLNSQLQAWRDSGEPMTPADLDAMYPAPDPADGPHAGDLYTTAFARLKDADETLTEGLPYLDRQVSPPPRDTPWPSPLLDRVETLLDHHAETRDLLRRAAAKGPAHFPIAFDEGFAALLPHLASFRRSMWLLHNEIVWHAHADRPDEAVETLLDKWRLADALRNEPLLISQLVRIAMINATADTTEWLVRHQDLSHEQLSSLRAAAAATLDAGHGLSRALLAERAVVHSLFLELKEGTTSPDYLEIGKPITLLRITGMYPRDHAYYLRTMDQLIAAADLRDPQPTVPGRRGADLPFYAVVSSTVIPAFDRAIIADLSKDARIGATIAGLAAARYRLDHGQYPESLNDLVPEYLDEIPADPFDNGAPLKYRRAETGVIIYSVGPNGTDHGGRELSAGGSALRGTDNDTDITFTLGDAQAELWPDRWPGSSPPEASTDPDSNHPDATQADPHNAPDGR